MINLTPYSANCFEFHEQVSNSKRNTKTNPNYQARLTGINPQIRDLFTTYERAFINSTLEQLVPRGFGEQDAIDLLGLYRFGGSHIKKLLISLTTKRDRKFDLCQMCTIDTVGSFDHIAPKEHFPEFIVNPKNLFPSCQKCNERKNDLWLNETGSRLFLNLYIDILPREQYLIVTFNDGYPIPSFHIDQTMLTEPLRDLINSHYQRLGLFRRFTESSSELIDRMVSEAISYLPRMSLPEFRAHVYETEERMRVIYGHNFWKSLLKIALVNHPEFEEYVNSQR